MGPVHRRQAGAGTRAAAPVDRAGGGRRRRLRESHARGSADLHPSRPRPYAGQGRRRQSHDGRTVRARDRHQQGQGRLDAHRRFRRRHARCQRRGRRRHADRRRRRTRAQDSRPQGNRRVFFRRRRGQSRAIHRSAELGGRLPPARAVRVRGQPDLGDHTHRPDDRRCRRGCAGREHRGAGHEGRRQRCRGRRRSGCTPRRRSARWRGSALPARGDVPVQGARLRRSRRVPRQGGSRGCARLRSAARRAQCARRSRHRGRRLDAIDAAAKAEIDAAHGAGRSRALAGTAAAYTDIQNTGAGQWR